METSVSSLLVGLIGDAVAEILNDEDNHPLWIRLLQAGPVLLLGYATGAVRLIVFLAPSAGQVLVLLLIVD
jgi:hypothetical protein